jgi:hypothetical protein
MNENIKAGADIHAGNGGYSESTRERYEAFVMARNYSIEKERTKMEDERISAFPTGALFNNDGQVLAGQNGMTLRDYFAAKAMQGMNSRDQYDPGQATPQQRAKLAYIDADAMMEARK